MNSADQRLYDLLPYLHHLRDQERGQPLQALLQVIAEQVEVVQQDIGQLYDNWFIETCQEWVVPYIGDLVGYLPVHQGGGVEETATERGPGRNRILIPRREVANTLRYRRRKGTVSVLEQLAHDVAGWPARVVEAYRLLEWAESLKSGQSSPQQAEEIFGDLAESVDILSTMDPDPDAAGVYVFVWRLKSYPISYAPAHCLEKVGIHCYTFSVLGNDTQLYFRSGRKTALSEGSTAVHLPSRISRAVFGEQGPDGELQASARCYGVLEGSRTGNSVAIWVEGWPHEDSPLALVPREKIVPADLVDWKFRVPPGHVAVDPQRGRIAFPPRHPPRKGVWVSYHYAFAADMGGGEYPRPLSQHEDAVTIRVTGQRELRRALEKWHEKGGKVPEDQPEHGVIEITDSGVYVVPLRITLAAGHTLQIRAAQATRPVLRLVDWSERPDNFTVRGLPSRGAEADGAKGSTAAARLVLDGLLIAGRGVQVEGEVASVTIRHCTLVPGWSLEPDCEPTQPSEPSIVLVDTYPCLLISSSIVGSIQVNIDEVRADPVTIRITDSIVDATGADCDSPQCEAIGAAGDAYAHAAVTIRRSTVIGRVQSHAVELAEDSIFMGKIFVARRQRGCMRFCYVIPESRTPRRFHCQPDLAEEAAAAKVRAEREDLQGADLEKALQQAQQQAREGVRPEFNSTRYGSPSYCRLADWCPDEIREGAEDESEMGVFNNLYQPQRLANLEVRVDEYIPAGMQAHIVPAS